MTDEMPPTLEQAHEEIETLRLEIKRLDLLVLQGDKSISDLNVQCKFWRQCAEHAVTGWNKLEDEHELLKETLRALVRDDEPAYLDAAQSCEVDIGLGPMRLVEDEVKR